MKFCFKVSDNTSRSTSVALVSRHGDTKARERAEVVVFVTPTRRWLGSSRERRFAMRALKKGRAIRPLLTKSPYNKGEGVNANHNKTKGGFDRYGPNAFVTPDQTGS